MEAQDLDEVYIYIYIYISRLYYYFIFVPFLRVLIINLF